MNEPHETNFHNTHHNLNLGEVTIFLLITYFVIDNKDSIKMAKKSWNFKMGIPKILNFASLWTL